MCSEDFAREPLVEVMAAEGLAAITNQHKQAQSGAMAREFVMRVLNGQDVDGQDIAGIRCDVSRRTFMPRDALLRAAPHVFHVHQDDVLGFQG